MMKLLADSWISDATSPTTPNSFFSQFIRDEKLCYQPFEELHITLSIHDTVISGTWQQLSRVVITGTCWIQIYRDMS